jgi:hypothetical protein
MRAWCAAGAEDERAGVEKRRWVQRRVKRRGEEEEVEVVR